MGSFRPGAVLGAALLIAAAACSAKQQGTPTAAADTSVPPTSKSGTPSGKPPVNRPKTIDLTATDGCKILGAMPGTEFGWPGAQVESADSSVFPGMKDCSVLVAGDFAANITTVRNLDVQAYVDRGTTGMARTEVMGFPAFTFRPTLDIVCFVGVDVAPGQMLYIQWNSSKPRDQRPTQDQICSNAAKVAAGAMKVLGAS